MSEQDQKEIMNARRLTNVGLIGTKLYLILIFTAIPAMAVLGWIKISPLELNQIGDFLAGLFGPLAIFWIVLGFFQQGEELRNSVETLKLQAKELAASVEQQRELVQVTREQLAHEREMLSMQVSERKKLAQPDFIISFYRGVTQGIRRGLYLCKIVNSGNSVSRVNLIIKQNEEAVLYKEWPFFGNGMIEDGINAFGGRMVPQVEDNLVAFISFTDSQNDCWLAIYDLKLEKSANGNSNFTTSLREIIQKKQ